MSAPGGCHPPASPRPSKIIASQRGHHCGSAQGIRMRVAPASGAEVRFIASASAQPPPAQVTAAAATHVGPGAQNRGLEHLEECRAREGRPSHGMRRSWRLATPRCPAKREWATRRMVTTAGAAIHQTSRAALLRPRGSAEATALCPSPRGPAAPASRRPPARVRPPAPPDGSTHVQWIWRISEAGCRRRHRGGTRGLDDPASLSRRIVRASARQDRHRPPCGWETGHDLRPLRSAPAG